MDNYTFNRLVDAVERISTKLERLIDIQEAKSNSFVLNEDFDASKYLATAISYNDYNTCSHDLPTAFNSSSLPAYQDDILFRKD